MSQNHVSQYYNEDPLLEWERLGSPFEKLEYLSTLRLIQKYFPDQGKICDLGCGPGRYSIELVKRGYEVTLFDLSEGLLKVAQEKLREQKLTADRVICGDSRDLTSFAEGEYDALLLMGPMYHLIDPRDRAQSLLGARRILKSGGIALISYLNILSLGKCGMTYFPGLYLDPGFPNFIFNEKAFEGSVYGGFTECYWTTSGQAIAEIQAAGFKVLTYAGCESFLSGMRPMVEAFSRSHPAEYEKMLSTAVETSERAEFRDQAEHLHFVVEKD